MRKAMRFAVPGTVVNVRWRYYDCSSGAHWVTSKGTVDSIETTADDGTKTWWLHYARQTEHFDEEERYSIPPIDESVVILRLDLISNTLWNLPPLILDTKARS
jgi:hypothetical protein